MTIELYLIKNELSNKAMENIDRMKNKFNHLNQNKLIINKILNKSFGDADEQKQILDFYNKIIYKLL